MKRAFLASTLLLLLMTATYALQPDFATDPAISPDGTQVCFVYDSDLWLVPFIGGEARRLTATPASEWGPCWSPDGAWIAFNANREGSTYPYLIKSTGELTRLVIAESYTISDWFSDGKNLLATRYNQGFGSSFYKVPVDGSRPVLLAEIGDRYASLSPDNKKIVFNRKGDPHRESYRGSVAGELWQVDIASKKYTRLTNTDFTERYPRFSHARSSLYYCASDGDRYQIYRSDDLDFLRPVKLTDFPLWSARDISIARVSDRLVFEHFNQIWKYDGPRGASQLVININEDLWQPDRRHERMKDDFHSFAVSDDELLVAFRYKYDTFFMPRKGGEVRRINFDHASVGNLEFLGDKRTLVMQVMDKGLRKLHTVTCDSVMTIRALDWFGKDDLDVESIGRDPSGKWIIYYGDNRLSSRIAVADSNLANIRALKVNRPVVSNFAINASGDYAVYATTREDFWTRELWLYDFAKDEHTKLLNEDAWINSLAWTPDNKSILMTRSGGIYRLDLIPRDEFEYEKDNWAEIFDPEPVPQDSTRVIESDYVMDITLSETESPKDQPATPKKKKAEPPKEVKIVWEGLDKRLYPVLTDAGFSLSVQHAIDDSTFYYISSSRDGNAATELKKANIYGQNSRKETELGRDTGDYTWVKDSIYFLKGGIISFFNTQKKSRGEVKAEFDYDYSVSGLNTRVFEQVWGVFGLNFYDPDMHGRDWAKLYQLYHPYAEKARSIDDIASIVNEMIGDVDASHTGFYPRREGTANNRQVASLGLEFDYASPLRQGVRVSRVYPTTRLADFYNLQAGDVLTHIDGVAITAKTPLDSLLTDKVGKRIDLRYTSDGVVKEAFLNGLSWAQNRQLYYAYDVSTKKGTVDELTQGRIGYIHIPAMGNRDFENFQRELFRDNADKEALIIDVRGNSGGHVHDQIISLLNRIPYAWSTSRRYSGERNPEPRRAWTRPTIVLVDESSFSDGEIFPTVYQELKLGKVVGMPSSGSVIGTWEYDLIDGSSMRMPGSGWYRLDGTNMEGNGVRPDIVVENSPEDEIAGRDTQLLRAIEEILKEI